MSFLDNLKLAREDDEVLAEGAAEQEPAEIDVTEAIQAEEDALEVAEQEQNIEEEQAEIETQSEVVEELQEQDAAIEEKLETPAEVTPEDVAVAQEAFAFTLGRIAGKSDVYKAWQSSKVSSEDAKTDPVSALKLHQEGVKEVAAKVWDSIKVMFQKVVEFFKRLLAKLPSLFSNFEKKATALKGQLEGLDASFKVEKAEEAAKKHLAFLGVLKDGSFKEIQALARQLSVSLPSKLARAAAEIKDADPMVKAMSVVKAEYKPVADGIEVKGEAGIIGLTGNGGVLIDEDGIRNVEAKNFEGKVNGLPKSVNDLKFFADALIKIAKDKDAVLKQSNQLYKAAEAALSGAVKGAIDAGDAEGKAKAEFARKVLIKLPGLDSKTYMTILRGGCGFLAAVIKGGEGKAEEKKEEAKEESK